MNTPSEKKGNLLVKVLKALLAVAFFLSVTACPPATGGDPESDPSKNPVPKMESKLIGTWAYDYGYNQDEFSNEELTFNADKTFIARYGESDYESGTYKIVNDKVHGLSIEWHFTEYSDKNEKKSSDVTSLYKCTFDDDDTVHLDRFSRDRTKMGGMFETFDPPRENTYYRIKNGTKETLTSGKWRVNKIGTPYCDWDETWTFNEDGTMVSDWLDGSNPGKKEGTYEIFKEEGKTILHQILEIGETTPAEWWYEYKTHGPNLINVNMIKTKRNGIENPFEEPYVNYYYREVETETINYHLGLGTYKHMVPKSDSYTLINHPWQLEAINNHFSSYEFLGWYDNKDFTGNPVTTVTGSTRDFYAKYNLTTQYETWKNDDGSTGADYYTILPASVVLNDEKDIQKPKRGENISILFEATLAEDIDGLTELNFRNWDYADNVWKVFGYDRRNIKTTGKKIKEVFNFTVPDKDIPFTDYYDDYCLVFYYNAEGDNKANTFSDWKYTILDDTDSYKITYKFGDVSYVARGLKDSDFELAKSESNFSHLDWRFDNFELLGWYDNPELTGTPVTSIPAGNTAEKTYYAKFNLRISGKNMFDDGKNYNYPIDVPLKSVLSGVSFNPKPGDTISIYFEATFKNDLDGWASVGIVDATNGGWRSIAGDGRDIKTTNKKMKEVFSMKINSNETLPTDINNYGFNFCYNPDACDDTNIISDWKIVLLDETNSYNITYNFGDVSYVARGLKDSDFELAKDSNFFEHINWNIAQSTEILGWYEKADFSGNVVTSIPAENTADKTYYAKFNLKGCRSGDWEDNGKMNHDYHVTVPVKALVPGNEFNPKPGDTVNIYFEATLSNDLNQWAGWQLQADGLNFTDFGPIVTSDKKLSKIFTIKIDNNVTLPSVDELYFDFWYSKEAYDGIITFSDWKFVLLDETNSYNITYKFGDVSFETKGLSNTDFELPKDSNFFEHINWNIAQSTEILGWYENAEFIGNSVTSIPAGNNFSKTLYAKFNPKITKSTWTNSDGFEDHNYNTTIPVKALLPGKNINPKAGDTISVYFEAKISHDLDGWGGLRLVDYTNGWNLIAQDWNNMKTEGNKLSKTFTIKIDENAKLPSIENLCFDFGYEKEAYDGIITFSDWKFVLLDETNSYNINYHFGNMVYTEREYTGNSFTLPTDLKTFESFDWNIANNIKFVEWKDGSGSTITEIPVGNTTDKDVYLKFNPFMSKWCADGDELENDYYFHLPAKMFLSESDLNIKLVGKKDVVKIEMTATINKTPDTAKKDRIWVELLDLSNCETQTFDLKDGILTATFEITPYDEVTAYPSADDLYIDFVYLDDFCSDYIEFTDFTLKFVE